MKPEPELTGRVLCHSLRSYAAFEAGMTEFLRRNCYLSADCKNGSDCADIGSALTKVCDSALDVV